MEGTKSLPVKAHPTPLADLGRNIWKNKMIYTLLIPGFVWYIVFAYMPMGGLSLAFKQFRANLGIWGSPWVGFKNFELVFRDAAFFKALARTIYINLGRLLFCFPASIIVALLINEFKMKRYSRILQTVYTFPHFFSWIIVASVFINVLSINGLANQITRTMTGGRLTINFLGDPTTIVPMLYLTQIWKTAGYGSIIYLAAISGIDLEQYEAAHLDGASRWQQMLHITLPNIMSTIIVMFVLECGRVLNVGFDQIFNMQNPATKDVIETINIYIYRITFQSTPDFGYSTAVSLFNSVINMLLLLLANKASVVFGGSGLFGTKE
jgi:putative aldouronate transport system permease protein